MHSYSTNFHEKNHSKNVRLTVEDPPHDTIIAYKSVYTRDFVPCDCHPNIWNKPTTVYAAQ